MPQTGAPLALTGPDATKLAAVIGDLLRQFDPSYGSPYPIYSPEGEWNYERFEHWLSYIGAPAWPRLDSGRLDVSSDAFRLMYATIPFPGVANLHALRDSIGFIAKARLPIGRDGRNRPSLFPFGTATGRNAHASSPFNAHASMRSFMHRTERVGALPAAACRLVAEIGPRAASGRESAVCRADAAQGVAILTLGPDAGWSMVAMRCGTRTLRLLSIDYYPSITIQLRIDTRVFWKHHAGV